MTFEISSTVQAASGRMTHASVFLLRSHPEGSPHYYFLSKNYKTQKGAAPPAKLCLKVYFIKSTANMLQQ